MIKQLATLAAVTVSAVMPASANDQVPFESVRAAYSAFAATTNETVRQSAYAYARGADIRRTDELGWLRSMARALGKEWECGDVCTSLATSTNSAVRIVALSWICDMAKLWDADRATALVDEWLARVDDDVAAKSLLLCRRMEARFKAGDVGGAEAAAAAVMSFGVDAPWAYYSQACFSRAEVLAKRGDAPAAEAMLSLLLGRAEVASPGVARRLVSIGVGREFALRFVGTMRERVADVPVDDLPAFKARVQGCEAEIVELLVHAGRLDEALGECRVMLLTASTPPAYGNAVRLAADVLKRIDGNLGRASAFLDSQKSNHVVRTFSTIPAYPALSDPVRVAEREKCIAYARENAMDWKAQLTCAYRLLWADCAEDSIRVALDAFALAPFSEKDLQVCADAVMHPFSVMTRNPAKVAIVRDYLLYGEFGRDGLAGTADDLSNPTEFYRSCTLLEPVGPK